MRRFVVLAVALVALSACSGGDESGQRYIFSTQDATVQVDTPQLRAQKAAAGIATCPHVDRSATSRHGGLPAFTLPCLGGGPSVNLAGLTGTPSVVNLWAQWCPPCRAESPIFQQLYDRAGSRVRVLGLDYRDPRPGMAIAFAETYHLTYPQLADPDAALQAPLRVTALPITLFVKADGSIAATRYGPVSSLGELEDLVRAKLGVRL